jgi:pantoate--beta-alanine ligase
MIIAETPDKIQQYLAPLRTKCIALVPTMGCLHEGHISLIRKAKCLADIVVVSIYVNPMQFGENEDFSKYPSTFEKDTEICKNEGVDVIFHPANLYPNDGAKITLKVSDMNNMLCGISRPSHFDGVVTVVSILFNIIRPNISIFGEKDWQQLAIIRRMVSDLHMPIEITGSDIIRESDGLAMSSRNRYLNPDERQKSLFLSQTMLLMKNNTKQGEKASKSIKFGIDNLKKYAICPEYLEIRDELTLRPENTITPQSRIFIASKIGKTRLIDNISLSIESENTL